MGCGASAAKPAGAEPQPTSAPRPITGAAPPPPPPIPESTIQYVRDTYKKHDSSGLSKLTHDEAKVALKELMGKPEAECDALLIKYDYDGDRRLEMKEFEALYTDLFEKDPVGKLFRKYDKSSNGKLQMIEAIEAMAELVGPTSRALISKFGDADVDSNGSLDLTEFTALYHTLLTAPEVVEEAYKAPLPPPEIVASPPPLPPTP